MLASPVYFIACAIGSSSASLGTSSALASEPGRTRQAAAVTADNCINWRLAILLKRLSSLLLILMPGTVPDPHYINTNGSVAAHSSERGRTLTYGKTVIRADIGALQAAKV